MPRHFVLYGGTSLALRLGHRTSFDFDFFSTVSFRPLELINSLPFVKTGELLQNETNTLTVLLERGGQVKKNWRPLIGKSGIKENCGNSSRENNFSFKVAPQILPQKFQPVRSHL
ncbi:MAG: nucleotidyl transferase AbiEii/AbiGii toxin family protein [Limisphaerales bacterium]